MGGKLILISGHCAAGKSTFAGRLSAKLGVPCFQKDRVKEILGDGLGNEGGLVYEKGSGATFLLMEHILERFLAAGGACILEGNFKPGELDRLRRLLEAHRGECLSFFFTGEMAVLYRRHREREGVRHWVHKPAGETLETFAAGQLRLGEDLPGQVVRVDTTEFERVDTEGLLAAARLFLRDYF